MFFNDHETIKIMTDFLKKGSTETTEETKQRLETCRETINYIIKKPYLFDETCKYNIKHIGKSYISYLQNFTGSTDEINTIHAYCYRFLCELEFSMNKEELLDDEPEEIKKRIEISLTPNQLHTSQITYAAYLMPAHITRELIKHKNIHSINNLEENFSKANNINEKINKELEDKIKEVELIKNKLDEYKTAFNFVGLHKGFDNLVSQKNNEKCHNSLLLTVLALLVIAPVAAASYYTISQLLKGTPISIDYLISAAPVLSLEIVLIYFFRIVLANNRSLKTQIMQLELRKSLCEFIQSYADYAKDIKTKDQGSLEKFENIIFSGIIAEPEKLPSTYDGLEQIGSLIKELRKS